MANELNISLSLSFSKGGATYNKSLNQSIDIAGDSPQYGVQEIDNAAVEDLDLHEDMGTIGLVLLHNLGDTDIRYGRITGVYNFKLLPGEFSLVRVDTGADLFLISTTSANLLEFVAFEV